MYPFKYFRAADIATAVGAMEDDAQYLAGGQSRIQAMKLRLSSTGKLVDLGGIAELRGIRLDAGRVVIGAMTTHAAVAHSSQLQSKIPALCTLAGGIGDQMVRNMGTLGGSLANADPAACYPSAVLSMNATIHTDRRTILADKFFTGMFETALQPGELITEVSFPVPNRAAYVKCKHPASRLALVGVCVSQFDGEVRVAVTGASNCVFRVQALESMLTRNFSAEVAQSFVMPEVDINGDIHGSKAYRARLVSVMAARAVTMALR